MVVVKNKPLRFGLYGEADFVHPEFIHCENIEFRTKIHNLIIRDHIHTSLFQIFVIVTGQLDVVVEETRRLVTGPAIVTIPENTLHGFKVGKTVTGKVLTLSTSFLETLFKNSPYALQELSLTHIVTEFDKSNSFEAISLLVDSLHREMEEDRTEKKLVLQSYCNLLLGLTYRLLQKKSEKLTASDSKNARYFRGFQKIVKQSYTPLKSIKEYARELNITAVHLNRICQATVGKSALQITHDFLVLEAAKFLKYTEMNISEIAYQLNFEDPAYFSRFFRKYTKLSPKQFREGS